MNYKLRHLVAATLAGTALLGFGANAFADTTDDIVNALIAKGVLTEEEGALLINARELEKGTKAKTPVAKFKDGLTYETSDGNFTFTPTGRVHADYRFFDYDDGQNNPPLVGAGNTLTGISNAGTTGVPDTFDIRRARIGFKTKYKEFYEAELNADISVGANSSVTATAWDVAYFNVAWWKPVQFRFGLFKMPMNLEELSSSNNIDFIERGYVNALAPQKEIGAMVHGVPFKGTTYALAVSNGTGKNAETDIREDGKDIIGRVTGNFAEMMDNKDNVYHAGLSFSTGDQAQGNVGVGGRTEGRGANFFKAPNIAAKTPFGSIDRTRVGVEGAVAINQFKVQGEWLQQNNEFSSAARTYNLDTNAWYLQALWTISGEKYADSYKNGVFGGIKPKNDFNPSTFSGGAWEVGLRYSKFDASDYNTLGLNAGLGALDAGLAAGTQAAGFAEAKSYTAGVKFLPNSNMRFMLNYVKTDFDTPVGGATGGLVVNNKREDSEQAVLMRAQWMF